MFQEGEGKMKKLAVIFPGVGYTCTKPLLYYTAAMAAEHDYEIIRLDYGQDIHTFHGRTPAELEPVIKLAIKRTLPQLENVPFNDYADIIFISKSIGTTISCQLEGALSLRGKVKQFLMTPIPSTLRYLSDINGLFFAGTADPYMPENKIRAAARNFPEKTGGIFEDCNHSLEQKGDTLGAIRNLRLIVECLEKMLV